MYTGNHVRALIISLYARKVMINAPWLYSNHSLPAKIVSVDCENRHCLQADMLFPENKA